MWGGWRKSRSKRIKGREKEPQSLAVSNCLLLLLSIIIINEPNSLWIGLGQVASLILGFPMPRLFSAFFSLFQPHILILPIPTSNSAPILFLSLVCVSQISQSSRLSVQYWVSVECFYHSPHTETVFSLFESRVMELRKATSH